MHIFLAVALILSALEAVAHGHYSIPHFKLDLAFRATRYHVREPVFTPTNKRRAEEPDCAGVCDSVNRVLDQGYNADQTCNNIFPKNVAICAQCRNSEADYNRLQKTLDDLVILCEKEGKPINYIPFARPSPTSPARTSSQSPSSAESMTPTPTNPTSSPPPSTSPASTPTPTQDPSAPWAAGPPVDPPRRVRPGDVIIDPEANAPLLGRADVSDGPPLRAVNAARAVSAFDCFASLWKSGKAIPRSGG